MTNRSTTSSTRRAAARPLGPVLALALILLPALTPAACAPPRPRLSSIPVTTDHTASSLTLPADWDDLDASVDVAAEAAQTAVVHTSDVSPDLRRFELISVIDEPGWLEASRAPLADTTSTGTWQLTLRARIGRFGNPERERILLGALAQRLEDLRAVDFRPLP